MVFEEKCKLWSKSSTDDLLQSPTKKLGIADKVLEKIIFNSNHFIYSDLDSRQLCSLAPLRMPVPSNDGLSQNCRITLISHIWAMSTNLIAASDIPHIIAKAAVASIATVPRTLLRPLHALRLNLYCNLSTDKVHYL